MNLYKGLPGIFFTKYILIFLRAIRNIARLNSERMKRLNKSFSDFCVYFLCKFTIYKPERRSLLVDTQRAEMASEHLQEYISHMAIGLYYYYFCHSLAEREDRFALLGIKNSAIVHFSEAIRHSIYFTAVIEKLKEKNERSQDYVKKLDRIIESEFGDIFDAGYFSHLLLFKQSDPQAFVDDNEERLQKGLVMIRDFKHRFLLDLKQRFAVGYLEKSIYWTNIKIGVLFQKESA